MPTTSKEPTKAELERQKLTAEIRKITAEATEAEASAAEQLAQQAYRDASNDTHRTYPFMCDVSTGNVRSCISALSMWHRRDPGQPITIEFNSPGGSVTDGLALYDYIDTIKREGTQVTTVARGIAASMGGVLLQAGDERIISANCHLLIHEISAGDGGKLSEIADSMVYWAQLSTRLLAILAERSTLTADEIKGRWERKDWWMGAEEAVELGFADVIG